MHEAATPARTVAAAWTPHEHPAMATSPLPRPSSVAARADGTSHRIDVSGPVDRAAARELDFLIRHGMWEPGAGVIIDISAVGEISGALIGALLRASRRLAWGNRRLTIVCSPGLRQRLEMAGLDELADVTTTGRANQVRLAP
jgi:anti-anti-sigma regulatory factor